MTNQQAFEAWAVNYYGVPISELTEECEHDYSVWQAATKHQDALIAAAYLDAANQCPAWAILWSNLPPKDARLLAKFIGRNIKNTTPESSKSALRELCLQVAYKAIEKCREEDAELKAATKHQDALIAAAYLDAANHLFSGWSNSDALLAKVTSYTPSDAKAALRELCLRVSNEAIEKYRVEDFAWDETAELEAIVDKVLAG